jgi:hypothetical protein
MADELIVAEFDSPDRVVAAAKLARALGYARVDAFTPFAISALDEALAISRTKLPYLVLLAGLSGAALAFIIQWWTNAIDYPINVGGRPPNSIPTHILIVFETTVLLASFTAFGAALLGSRLPRLHHPVFDLPGFERTTLDRFWLTIQDAYAAPEDVRDKRLAMLDEELARLGALSVRGIIRKESSSEEGA